MNKKDYVLYLLNGIKPYWLPAQDIILRINNNELSDEDLDYWKDYFDRLIKKINIENGTESMNQAKGFIQSLRQKELNQAEDADDLLNLI